MSVQIRSDGVALAINDLLTRQTLREQLDFYKMARATPDAESLAGIIFEYLAHRQLEQGGTYRMRKLSPRKKNVRLLILIS